VILSIFFFLFVLPIERIAAQETYLVSSTSEEQNVTDILCSILVPQEVAYLPVSNLNVVDHSSGEALC
jgi:hypothetical protein